MSDLESSIWASILVCKEYNPFAFVYLTSLPLFAVIAGEKNTPRYTIASNAFIPISRALLLTPALILLTYMVIRPIYQQSRYILDIALPYWPEKPLRPYYVFLALWSIGCFIELDLTRYRKYIYSLIVLLLFLPYHEIIVKITPNILPLRASIWNNAVNILPISFLPFVYSAEYLHVPVLPFVVATLFHLHIYY